MLSKFCFNELCTRLLHVKASEGDLMIAATIGARKMTLFGDEKQLGPNVHTATQQHTKLCGQFSLFERIRTYQRRNDTQICETMQYLLKNALPSTGAFSAMVSIFRHMIL